MRSKGSWISEEMAAICELSLAARGPSLGKCLSRSLLNLNHGCIAVFSRCFPTRLSCSIILLLSLDEEVRLYTTNTEREKYESLATLYGIIVSLDYLERAYVRDAVPADEYGPKCVQLLGRWAPSCRSRVNILRPGRYKTMWGLVTSSKMWEGEVEDFMSRYRVIQLCLHKSCLIF